MAVRTPTSNIAPVPPIVALANPIQGATSIKPISPTNPATPPA